MVSLLTSLLLAQVPATPIAQFKDACFEISPKRTLKLHADENRGSCSSSSAKRRST